MRLSYSLLFALSLSLPCLSSSGDRASEFTTCVQICTASKCQPHQFSLPLVLRLTRWTCNDDCKYTCMHAITDASPVTQQYFGKWPFWRLLGMQEPASVLFSLGNLCVHAYGARKMSKAVRDSHPMKGYLLNWSMLSVSAWVWSAVFHTRGKQACSAIIMLAHSV